MKRKKTDTVQLSKIRIREELRQKLVRAAEKNDRTLTGEIVERLEASFKREDIGVIIDATAQRTRLEVTEQLKALQSAAEAAFAAAGRLEALRSTGALAGAPQVVAGEETFLDAFREILPRIPREELEKTLRKIKEESEEALRKFHAGGRKSE
jgi:hypothetical protein